MRKPAYLSPTSLALWKQNPEDFYLQYLADDRPPRTPQSPAMSVGSAFDAFVKSYLHENIYGKNHPESCKYNCKALFEAQVSPHNRDICWPIGQYLFDQYKVSGALSDLMLELQGAVDDPRFEFTVQGVVNGYREGITKREMGVPLLGKPDIRFANAEAASVVVDWKINGWFAKGNTSPMAGYVQCREQQSEKHWMRLGSHKDAFCQKWKGIEINTYEYLENLNRDWAAQLATYSWLLGEQVGVETIIGIDQIVCHGGKRMQTASGMDVPMLRAVSHRLRVGSNFQFELINDYQTLWAYITEEPFHYFRDLSLENSALKCQMLDEKAALHRNPDLSDDEKAALEWANI